MQDRQAPTSPQGADTGIEAARPEELIANFGHIDGPGNNSHLCYDPGLNRLTVVAWDHNLAFGAGPRAQGIGPPPGVLEPEVGPTPNIPERKGRPDLRLFSRGSPLVSTKSN